MTSHWNARTRILLIAAAVLLLFNVARQGYRWVAYADEREVLRRQMADVDTAALAAMSSRIQADSLRGSIEAADLGLRRERQVLAALERRADDNRLPPMLYEEYREVLERYNGRVAARNDVYESWRVVLGRNRSAVDRYNALADSIRDLGARIGEPYIAVPSPAEVAVRHGLTPRDAVGATPSDRITQPASR